MQERMNYAAVAPQVLDAMLGVHKYLQGSGLDKKLKGLVYLRASQINRCAYCIDMHWKDLRAMGASEQDLYMVSAWREWNGYSDRERAALAWTEAVTLLTDGFVPDEVYESVRQHFSDEELAKLTLAIASINAWNRLNVAFRKTAGGYRPTVLARESVGV